MYKGICMTDLTNIKYDVITIIQKRIQVREQFFTLSNNIKNGNIEVISEKDLQLLFKLYDTIFLESYFRINFKGILKFKLSHQMTKSAGITKTSRNISVIALEKQQFEIKISLDFLFDYYKSIREKSVGGIITNDPLDVLMLVFEHEICHVIEFLVFKFSSCKKERFKTISNNIFGHKESYHKLATNSELIFTNYGLKPNDKVSFEYEEKLLKGIIYRINKRATVMVEDKKGTFTNISGKRFSKYYMPINTIKKL
jgi:hypothetical protein